MTTSENVGEFVILEFKRMSDVTWRHVVRRADGRLGERIRVVEGLQFAHVS